MENDKAEFDLIVVGEINPDLILRGDVTPEFGQVEKLVDSADLTIGSSSCIFACGAARLGLKVAFIGKVGDDDFGRFMLNQLSARGIDTSGVVVDPTLHTGLSVILSRGNDRAILTYSGSISELCVEEVNGELLARGRHLHLGAYYLLDRLRPDVPELFALAHKLGLSTSLDTNYDPTGCWDGRLLDVLEYTDVFLPNQTELLAITRVQDLESALEKMSIRRTVAVKLGAEGGLARCGNDRVSAKALSVNVVDTTGAGDTFDAGFLYGYLNGWDLEQSLKLACVCGSLSTTGVGGISAQPTVEEALSHL